MRIPVPPPEFSPDALQRLQSQLPDLLPLAHREDRYLPWDEFRRRRAPTGLSVTEWWFVTRLTRDASARPLPLSDRRGQPFRYCPTDPLLQGIDEVNARLSSPILDITQRQALINSRMEESIASSQLEGAATTREVARRMLRGRRRPRTDGERMIANNYAAALMIGEHRDQPLTEEFLLELHRTLTTGTLKDPTAAGRMQRPGEPRVVVADLEGNDLHVPPPAEELPGRMEQLIAFTNGVSTVWLPPLLRAFAVHFMVGHDHFFVDGNGRLARALFHWTMLRQGFDAVEFAPISRLLLRTPARYGRAYLHTELESDLTYFFLFQLDVLLRSLTLVEQELASTTAGLDLMEQRFKDLEDRFNHRQLALLTELEADPNALFTVASHATTHGVSLPTAQSDLDSLTTAGLLVRHKRGRRLEWRRAPSWSES